jgi:glycosyltransferase involved in cell wall biosynthesis
MLCYFYPPLLTSGATRSLAFGKHLPTFGWTPSILTVKDNKDPWVKTGATVPDDIEIIRAPEWNLNGLAALINGAISKICKLFGHDLKTDYPREILCLPDSQIAWLSTYFGLSAAKNSDCIYATCSPFSSAVSGVFLKKLSGKPLVLDFRDPWTLNQHTRPIWIHKQGTEILERFVISNCDKLILNTPGAEELYRNKYSEFQHKFLSIPNGYDSLQLVEPKKPNSDDSTIRIMHVGNFYGTRNPDNLLEALTRIGDSNIEFVQVGGSFPSFEHYKSRVKITVTGMVSREEALEHMNTASILFVKQGFEEGVEDYVAVAAKTYEYLACGLPVLADCPIGDNAEIINNYGACSYVVCDNLVDSVENAVRTALQEKGWENPRILDTFIESFDRKNLTKKLANTLREACQQTPPHTITDK